jgi:uncharacterized phiE125 gp8 family phage protein
MSDELITPPTEMAVSLADVKANLRIDGTDLDSIVTIWIKGVIRGVENETNRALIRQGRRVTLDSFPRNTNGTDGAILLRPRLISVTSVQFKDESGVLQTLDPTDYKVDDTGQAGTIKPGWIVPAKGKGWPATDCQINTVIVDYICGDGETAGDVPPDMALYLIAKVTEQFDPAVRPERETVQSNYLDRRLDPYRVYGL